MIYNSSYLICDFVSIVSIAGSILVAIFALLVMVLVHELGHYSMGKLLGFKIEEFAIGFGKPIYKRTNKAGEQFSIRPIPLGGFCAFTGEDEENTDSRAFNNQKPWKRLVVLFAGAFFNFVTAIILIALTFTFYGDRMLLVTAETIEQGAGDIGFVEDDIIYSVDGVELSFVQPFPDKVEGQETRTYGIIRGGEKTSLILPIPGEGEGSSISFLYTNVRFGFFESIPRAFVSSFRMVGLILKSFTGIFTGRTPMSDLGGPVTVIGVMGESLSLGLGFFMYIVCLISANLAIFNLMPIPALDGSRMVFTIIEWIRGKPIKRSVESAIHFMGLVLLFGFAILVDVAKLF